MCLYGPMAMVSHLNWRGCHSFVRVVVVVFADGLFLREPIRESHECATDGCTVGHLYLSQMIFGQGDPWSLV